MTNVKRLSEIKAAPVLRNRTFFNSLDHVYGMSDKSKGDVQGNFGMPKGKISLWAGQSGVGKSRLCIEVAKKFSTNYTDGRVLYIQTESPLEDFASWAKDTGKYDNIFCSGVETQKDIIDVIYQVKPKLIFIDSVNEIVDFTGNAKSSSRLIKGDKDQIGLKQATHDAGAHLILLGQLNGDKSIKGGTSLPHLVDIALNVVWENEASGVFRVEVGVKHRYGSRDKTAKFIHYDDCVMEDCVIDTPIAPVVTDPKLEPSMYHRGRYIGSVTPFNSRHSNFWTIKHEEYYLKNKADMVARGEIKVDNNGNIIPKDRRSLLRKINDGIENMFT